MATSFYDGGFFDGDFFAATAGGAYERDAHAYGRRHTEEDVRRDRERLGILPAVDAVIDAVALRQAENTGLDAQQRLEELERELALQSLEFEGRYLELLNERRGRLIDAEIRARLKVVQENEELLLFLLAVT